MKLFNLTLFLLALMMILCGCRRVIESPRDELVQFRWSAKNENGDTLSLTFGDDGSASFSVRNDADELVLNGLCAVYDDHFVICDDRTDSLYSFGYMLHGDCVDLTYDDGSLTLDKVNDT